LKTSRWNFENKKNKRLSANRHPQKMAFGGLKPLKSFSKKGHEKSFFQVNSTNFILKKASLESK
jgi:hypothetical protein